MKQKQVEEEGLHLPQSVKDQTSGLNTSVISKGPCLIFPLTLKRSKLTAIKERLEDIVPKTRKKGPCGVIKSIILRKEIARSLQKCVSDLDSEIEAFHVSSDAL